MEDKFITVIDDDGKENAAEVIFTFVNDDDNYVLLTLVNDIEGAESINDEYEVLAYRYEEDEQGNIGKLIEIDENDKARWDIVEEVFATFEETAFSYVEEE